MKFSRFFDKVRSAHQLASAFENHKTPPAKALADLGLTDVVGDRFKR